MPRKRYLKPSFNDDDDIKGLSDSARLLYALLWGHMDRNGVIEDSVQSIRSKVYPREDRPIAAVAGYLAELLAAGPSGRPRLYRFQWRGRVYLYAPTMPRHQKIYSDEPAVIPMTAAELAGVVEDFEKSAAMPQPGTVTGAVHSQEQKVDGEHLSTGGAPEQGRASSFPSAPYLSSAPTSAQGAQDGNVDKSGKSSDKSDAIKIIDRVIAKGSIETARGLITVNQLSDHYRQWLDEHKDRGSAPQEGHA